jgi:hypothetical protein
MFVGYDKNGTARSCNLRSSNPSSDFKGYAANSDKQYDFCIEGKSKVMRVFESPIDAMSNATFTKLISGHGWDYDTRISLGGVEPKSLFQRLDDYPDTYKSIVLCLDNDEAGRHGTEKIKAELAQRYGDKYSVSVVSSFLKDWNADLAEFTKIADNNNVDSVKAYKMLKEQINGGITYGIEPAPVNEPEEETNDDRYEAEI